MPRGRKYAGTRGRTTAKFVRKIVRAEVKKDTELKWYDIDTSGNFFMIDQDVGSTPTAFDIVNPAAVLPDVGVNVNQRTGNEIRVHSVHYRLSIDVNPDAMPSFNKLRFSVIRPWITNISLSDLQGSTYSNDTVYGIKNQQIGRFLRDSVHQVSLNGTETYSRFGKITFGKTGMRSQVDTFGSCVGGRLCAVVISDSPDNPPAVKCAVRVFYTDA